MRQTKLNPDGHLSDGIDRKNLLTYGLEKRYVRHNIISHNSLETTDLRQAIVNYRAIRRLHRIQ